MIYPQTIYKKDMRETILCDTIIEGSFEGVDVREADFTGSKGAIIDPKELWPRSLSKTNLCDVTIIPDYDGIETDGTIFDGCTEYEDEIYLAKKQIAGKLSSLRKVKSLN